ncbi:DUF4435 domain-containing protein [Halomonas alkaliantarctica]|uniref:DUF4435 domain-containing protein n=1 Tax=Halomonas alkaliantarctica TaxID=232346 RepID=UPI00265B6C48|nr:DUF4435 domain-containing protein [Halomonas alkaliantarctica]
MSFTRTSSGLSNLAIFHDVDYILFTEGGETSFSLENVKKGFFNRESVDIKFWSKVLSKHGCNARVEFRALGSKTASKEICDLIEKGKVKNVIVALDSDLDGVLGVKYQSPYIFYTRGYSWENDVYNIDLVKEQVESFILSDRIPQECKVLIDELYSEIERLAPRLMRMEVIFRQNSMRFITDLSGERLISRNSIPKININQIMNVLEEKKVNLDRPVRVACKLNGFCSFSFCYGKLVEALAMSLLSYIAKTFARIKSLPKELMITLMIDRYSNRKGHNEDLYYEEMVSILK